MRTTADAEAPVASRFVADVAAPGERARVLFVDDEPHLLAGLRRMLRRQRDGWDMEFASSAAEALELVDAAPVDVLVSDMRMPGMDGAQLLAAVQGRSPSTVRIILSGQSDRASVLAAVGHAQQFLAKPCDEATLTAAVERALAVRRRLTDPVLRELLGGVVSLPVLPAVYHELVRATENPGGDLGAVAELLASDVATSAEVLKLVNSAFFGLPREVSSVPTAVSLLGLDNLQALVLTGSLFRADDGRSGIDVEGLRDLALRRTAIGRAIAGAESWDQHTVNYTGLCCMLRDVGLLVLARGLPEPARALASSLSVTGPGGPDPADVADPARVSDLEREAFGCTVAQASAHLLGLWGFLPAVVCAVADQPLPWQGVAARPLIEHVLDFAHRRASAPGRPVPAVGYLDGVRLERWNASADETEERWVIP